MEEKQQIRNMDSEIAQVSLLTCLTPEPSCAAQAGPSWVKKPLQLLETSQELILLTKS